MKKTFLTFTNMLEMKKYEKSEFKMDEMAKSEL